MMVCDMNSIAAECGCKNSKTINSRYSLVVTHPTTNLPAHGLRTAERTGSPVFHVLWSIAKGMFEKASIAQATPNIKSSVRAGTSDRYALLI
jgi:hypothetical protein